jgi:hypothetical protein
MYLSETLGRFSAESLWTYAIAIIAFAVSAVAWFHGRWVTAIIAMVLAHATPTLVTSLLKLI